MLPDGRYGYSVKKSSRRACRARIITPVECLARLCALVPPPYYPLTRYHGVIAPRAKPRKAIVPQPPHDARPSCSAKRSDVAAGESKRDVPLMIPPADARSRGEAPCKPCSVSQAMALESSGRRENSSSCANGQALLQLDSRPCPHACSRPLPTGQRPLGARVIAELLSGAGEVDDAHNVLSVRHWDRVGRGLLYAATSAVPWAILHARTFDQDVLLCGRCSGRLRIMKK